MKIKKPKIREVLPKVFLVTTDNQFDLAMLFCRFQEYYESPDMAGKQFTFTQFMKYYANKWGNPKGSFSYTDDWDGFNIPGPIIRNCLIDNFIQKTNGLWVTDYMNEYEEYMVDQILQPIVKRNSGWNFYLIGNFTGQSKKTDASLVCHEIAHGLYFTNSEYKEEIDNALKVADKKTIQYLKRQMKRKGYTNHVIQDELQAYLTTGLASNMDPKKVSKKEMNKFFKILKRYYKKAETHNEKFTGK